MQRGGGGRYDALHAWTTGHAAPSGSTAISIPKHRSPCALWEVSPATSLQDTPEGTGGHRKWSCKCSLAQLLGFSGTETKPHRLRTWRNVHWSRLTDRKTSGRDQEEHVPHKMRWVWPLHACWSGNALWPLCVVPQVPSLAEATPLSEQQGVLLPCNLAVPLSGCPRRSSLFGDSEPVLSDPLLKTSSCFSKRLAMMMCECVGCVSVRAV